MSAPRTPGPVPTLTGRRVALLAVGGVLGSTARWQIVDTAPPFAIASLPWATLAVDVVGTVVLAAALVTARRRPEHASILVDGVGTGFCGGLTTFSTFAVGIATQLRSGAVGWAMLTSLVVVAAGISSAVAVARLWAARGVP